MDILFGVSQGFVLGPLLSNIFDMFLFQISVGFDIYVGDNTPYYLGTVQRRQSQNWKNHLGLFSNGLKTMT